MSAIDDVLNGKDRYFYDCDCEKCQSFRREIEALRNGARKVILNTGWCPCCDSDHGHTATCPMKDERQV